MKSKIDPSEYEKKYKSTALEYDAKAKSIGFTDPIKEVNLNQLLQDILNVEYEKHGIDWRKFYSGEDLQSDKVNKYLKSLGLSATAKDLAQGNNVDEIPNIFITNRPDNHYVDYVEKLRGSEIEKYIAKMVSSLQIAEKTIYDDLEGAAFTLAIGGIGGLAVTWMGLTGIGLSFGWGVVGSSVAAAASMGAAACGTLIGVVIVAAVGALFAIMNKDAQVLTLILNRTDANLNITGKYFKSGKLLSEPEAIISIDRGDKCSILAAIKEGPYEMVNAGWLNVTKKTGVFGVSGAIKMDFEAPSPFDENVYLGFEVPYSHVSYNNGCDISLGNYKNTEAYYNAHHKSFSTNGVQRSEADHSIQVYQADKNASSNSMIAVVQAPFRKKS